MEEKEQRPVISVLLLAYNHERYICHALDSILNQKTEYPFEIIIGNDCSSDNTEKIIIKYFYKYPQKIRVIRSKHNVGGTAMYLKLLEAARGDYIATLEGDDYWNSEEKLQKQTGFLESHPEYEAVSHRISVVDEDEIPIAPRNDYSKNTFWNYRDRIYTIRDFQDGCYAGHASGILFRNFMKDDEYKRKAFAAYRSHRIIGDRTTSFLIAMRGTTYRMDDVMSCYRFVESMDASNYQATTRQRNIRDEEYRYICRLEDLGKQYTGKKFSMYPVLKDKLIGASIYALDHPSSKNLQVLFRMIKMRKQKVKYIRIVILSIIKKLFYRKILKEDRPVTIGKK